MPGARVAALKTVARAAVDDPTLFRPLGSIDDTIARLEAITGIGPWTAHYIALRACREPDAFPGGDAGLRRSFARLHPRAKAKRRAGGDDVGPPRAADKALVRYAEVWRPWRAYAAQHLWSADDSEAAALSR